MNVEADGKAPGGRPRVLLSAGGTGGHLFPAEALATALKRLGIGVILATDRRAGALAGSFPADEIIQVASATPSGGSPLGIAKAAVMLGLGFVQASRALRRLRPAAVVGFGGYPTVPPVAAAAMLRIPTIVHEQNGVMGRANRFLARRVSAIATGFPEARGIPQGIAVRVVHTGNPVRPAVLEAARMPYPAALRGGKLRLLVFGGSQGARVMGDVVPAAVERLPKDLLPQLVVTQQAREEDALRVMKTYARIIGHAEVQPFFKDLPRRMAESHLVVSRSGASTVAELAVIGRPAILVPLPGALDQDQAANAQVLATAGAATVIPQAEFTPERLAREIVSRFGDPGTLSEAAEAAKSVGVADAAERLAALVLHLAKIPLPELQRPAEEETPGE
jgi:UDP-N-acetylglucosamine--N-acetylmuramyl-(pentapeptide) pyrophosphoryl-undecaprenol N-acetylglucosamine transferase